MWRVTLLRVGAGAVAGLAGAAGCYAFVDPSSYDTTEAPSEAAADAPPVTDGGCPALTPCGPCDLTQPFASVEIVPNVNSPEHEFSGRLSEDGKTLYIDSKRDGTPRLYVATRTDPARPFEALMPLAAAAALEYPRYAGPTADELVVVLAAAQVADGDGGGLDVFWMKRSRTTEMFGIPSLIPGLGAKGHNDTPSVTGDGQTLLFISDRDDGKTRVAYQARLGPDGATALQKLEVTGESIVDNPVLGADGLTLYFSQPPRGALFPYHVARARRPTRDAPFRSEGFVDELNSTGFEWPTWVSSDGCQILFGSSRAGNADIWTARKPSPKR